MLELNEKTISKVVRNNPLVVVDCWAPWCHLCLYFSPLVEDLSRIHIKKILFAKVDLSKYPKVGRRFSVKGVPTLLIFKDGKLVEKIVGIIPTVKLEPLLLKWVEEKKNE